MDEVPQFPAGPPTGGDASPVVTRPARPLPPRALDRPPPRWSTAVAAAGAAFAITGSLFVSGDALDGADSSDGSQLPGLLVSLLLLAGGLALLAKGTSTALRTAGSVAAVVAVPAVVFFATFDAGGFPPFSFEGILGVSAGVWIAYHLVGPTAGRLFPLGAGVVALWLFLLQVTEEPFTAPFDILGLFFAGGVAFEDESVAFSPFDVPDPTNLGALTLALAAAYLYGAHRFDKAGAHGRAFAVGAPVVVMVPVGVALLASELEAIGSGLLLCALGVSLSLSGAGRERRGTTWAGALFLFYGLGLLVDEAVGDEATPFGLASLAVGSAVVAAAHFLADVTGEPEELAAFEEPQPSTGSTHPWGPPPGPPDAPVDGGFGS